MKDKPKILAINLPAFHRIPENDKWWGDGFTEWDNVKKGEPYFFNHHQPEVPEKGYYDLSKKEDILNQVLLAKKYNIYGFIYYHYWFGEGKKIFEKPAEILRDEIKEDFNYCFCWANESWIATWHGQNNELLLEQKYGDIKEWERHIKYLIPFFNDDRYIKVNNSPMLYIYKPNEIPNYEEMIIYFNNFLIKNGYNGIYIVEYISSKNKELHSKLSSSIVEFEPLYTTYFDISLFNKAKRYLCKKIGVVDYQSYDKLWKLNLKRKRTYNFKNIQKSCFVSWDNSPRKGKKSMIVKGSNPDKFKIYLDKLINSKRKDANSDFIVINAWNEWSEGAKLEPCMTYHNGYLNAIKEVVEKYEKK